MDKKEELIYKKIKEFCETNNISVFAFESETGMTVAYCKNDNDRIILLNIAEKEKLYIDEKNKIDVLKYFTKKEKDDKGRINYFG